MIGLKFLKHFGSECFKNLEGYALQALTSQLLERRWKAEEQVLVGWSPTHRKHLEGLAQVVQTTFRLMIEVNKDLHGLNTSTHFVGMFGGVLQVRVVGQATSQFVVLNAGPAGTDLILHKHGHSVLSINGACALCALLALLL